jgi:putative DNA primase/helicase
MSNTSISQIEDCKQFIADKLKCDPPDEIIVDAIKELRFSTNGGRKDKAGSYKAWFESEILVCLVYDHRAGIGFKFYGSNKRNYSGNDLAVFLQQQKANRLKREQAQAQEQAIAVAKALALWQSATPYNWIYDGNGSHRYAYIKHINHCAMRNVRVITEGSQEVLLIPMYDGNANLRSLLRIYPDGKKRFFPGISTTGLYYCIGSLDGRKRLIICEGFATGVTLHDVTDYPVVVAFSCHNLLAVAKILRAKYPDFQIVICADDDWQRDNNPGVTNAHKAAAAIGATVRVPDFSGFKREPGDTDFNDLARLEYWSRGARK